MRNLARRWGAVGRFKRDEPELSTVEIWQRIGGQLGLSVEFRGDRSLRATGTVRGRPVAVDIDSDQKGSEFLRSFARVQRRSRVHRRWITELTVGCDNPRRVRGTIESVTDLDDPDWDPRNFDPSQCRVIRSDPPELAATVLTSELSDRLMGLVFDTRIEIDTDVVRLREDCTADAAKGAFGATMIHSRPGPILPMPNRALAGPPWWIDLLCDVAAAVDR
jgi:hypothetical protein